MKPVCLGNRKIQVNRDLFPPLPLHIPGNQNILLILVRNLVDFIANIRLQPDQIINSGIDFPFKIINLGKGFRQPILGA